MSRRYQAGILGVGFNPLLAPNAPTSIIPTAASTTTISVAFTAPSNIGGSAITGYTVVASNGQTAIGASSPIIVSGLSIGTSYTFVVYANNVYGPSPASATSASVSTYKVPGAPTGVSATAGDQQATVSFTAPSDLGVPASITGYRVTSSPGGFTATGASSPITVTGLTNNTAYTFTVEAQNAAGYGPASSASNSVTPTTPSGQQAYTTAGTYSWVVPTGVTSASVICIGGGGIGGAASGGMCGGGGGGGALAYVNNIAVTPGETLTVIVGDQQAASYFKRSSTNLVAAGAGNNGSGSTGGSGGTVIVGTGFPGGSGGSGGASGPNQKGAGGGGGAGGYSAAGGNGGSGSTSGNGNSSTGGGGGGGGSGVYMTYGNVSGYPYYGQVNGEGAGGGGTGLLGAGGNGSGGGAGSDQYGGGGGGGGGSGGGNGVGGWSGGTGGLYGGGGGGGGSEQGLNNGNPYGPFDQGGHAGRWGAVRIIWGSGRAFPSTNTGNV